MEASLQVIASNDFYTILVCKEKRRLYIHLQGFWKSCRLVPHYLEHLYQAAILLGDEYTCLADFSKLMPFSEEVKVKVHIPAMLMLLKTGLKAGAQVMPVNLATSQQLADIGQELKIPLHAFGDDEIADKFLDASSVSVFRM